MAIPAASSLLRSKQKKQMVDLHTHILFGVDDGPKDLGTSLRMLQAQRDQGVDAVVLTPHFYRYRERPSSFFARRQEAWDQLQEHLTAELPQVVLGAEVAWVPNLADCDDLDRLCIGNTKHMLLELPFTKWDSSLANQIYDLMGRTGITPILAHLERYVQDQRPEILSEILSLELPVQISSTPFLHLLSRGKCLKLLQRCGHVIASDCHDLVSRKPDLAEGMAAIKKKLGSAAVRDFCRNARYLAGLD
jgi:protein-tyrosine phosphatase